MLTGEGLRIFTSLDVHAQKLAEKAIARQPRRPRATLRLAAAQGKEDQLEEALIAVEPQSGKIRAMVGGRDYRESQFNRVTQSRRQPGSAFKPVTYLAAMEETLEGGPEHFLPTTYIDDTPFTWDYGDMSWTPKNYKNRYFGRVTLEFALEESLNAATSRLANQIGLDRVRAMAERMGFGDLPSYPSIVLGGIEVTPMQIAQAYSIMADDGIEVQSYAVTAVVDQSGKVIEGHELQAASGALAPTRLHDGFHARASHQSRHRRGRAQDAASPVPPPARPAPPMIPRTPGSPASRPTCWPSSGPASIRRRNWD